LVHGHPPGLDDCQVARPGQCVTLAGRS
jgi:hypothetical protein